eukprot:scaffold1351_cov359-Prasinococcus_capsulatus_cf.AAC.11
MELADRRPLFWRLAWARAVVRRVRAMRCPAHQALHRHVCVVGGSNETRGGAPKGGLAVHPNVELQLPRLEHPLTVWADKRTRTVTDPQWCSQRGGARRAAGCGEPTSCNGAADQSLGEDALCLRVGNAGSLRGPAARVAVGAVLQPDAVPLRRAQYPAAGAQVVLPLGGREAILELVRKETAGTPAPSDDWAGQGSVGPMALDDADEAATAAASRGSACCDRTLWCWLSYGARARRPPLPGRAQAGRAAGSEATVAASSARDAPAPRAARHRAMQCPRCCPAAAGGRRQCLARVTLGLDASIAGRSRNLPQAWGGHRPQAGWR